MKAEIYIVSHKPVKVPRDKMYLPVQVGISSENFKGFCRDNTGDNISSKNPNYCELTAQYWAWKNRQVDVKGLVHYRRYFSNGKSNFFKSYKGKFADIMTSTTLQKFLEKAPLILPKKRNYFIETSWSHYEHVHHIKDLQITRQIVAERFPDYLPSFDKMLQKKAVHMFNMLIARADIFDNYTQWLFQILPEVEKRADISDYTPYEKRIYGFLGEILLDVWVDKNQIPYVEVPVMFMGNQHWVKKVAGFLYRKFKK
ncbi:DUF4422 domain-containing protein [Liquorilactobacillus vini]|uniref:DUF4422 domain-containing protein n=1 Tax=Liquorilactobacillus vini TaxID=238015 RepID=UPI0002DD1B52|nr:DUF4422 domain-containing protein [Liquorilactobacillus vini]